MFKSISWQEYLHAVGLLSVGYYVVVVATLYSRDILIKFRGGRVPRANTGGSNYSNQARQFMGAVSDTPRKIIPIKQSVANTEDLTIESDPEDLLAGLRADSPAVELFENLEEIFLTFAIGKTQKPKYIVEIKKLFRKHSDIKGTASQSDVNGFIRDYFRGHNELSFTVEELDTLWLNEKHEVIIQSTTKNNYEK